MKISVIGAGHVGLMTAACFAEKGHRVVCVDNNREKIETLMKKQVPFYEPGMDEVMTRNIDSGRLSFSHSLKDAVDQGDLIFISVGTPPTATGEADLSYIENVSRDIGKYLTSYRVIIEKSTVPVRTGERLRETILKHLQNKSVEFDVASNPEFLREGSAIQDAMKPDRIVIGVSSPRAEKMLRELYEPFGAPIVVTDIKSAELIKHASNSFLAMKISFINAVASVCELAGANVDDVARGMGMDSRIGPHFLNAGIGYGGSCFPKDLEAFVAISKMLGYPFTLLEEVQKINADARDRFLKKIEHELWVVKGKHIAMLGLAFKSDTDDVRNSVPIEIAQVLTQKGAKLVAYDPKAITTAREVLKGAVFASDPYEAVTGADCMLLMTEWNEFRKLDFDRIKSLMAHPVILDGRNMYDPAVLRSKGFQYISVGRP